MTEQFKLNGKPVLKNGIPVTAGELIAGKQYEVNLATLEIKTGFTVYPIDTAQGRMYCGATVIALLTGKDRATIHRDFNKLIRKRGIKRNKWSDKLGCWTRVQWSLNSMVTGMSNKDLEALLTKNKISHKKHEVKYGSLRQLVDDMGHLKNPIVINVTGHYVLYHAGKVYDTFHREGATIADHPCAGKRVQKYWLIRRQPSKQTNEERPGRHQICLQRRNHGVAKQQS